MISQPLARAIVLACAGILLSGCNASYYWQAAMGHWDVLNHSRPISEVLDDPGADPALKKNLRTVLKAQSFAAESLALPREGHYTTYANLNRGQVSWLVVASEKFAFRAYQQCFIVVGCLGYRGYFDRADAAAYAADLSAEGYDVIVRPVAAYSTLGWFEDPLLNTMLGGDVTALVATVFHEQAHGLIFLKGETGFNESFATFVSNEGLRRFLREHKTGTGDLLARYHAKRADRSRWRGIVLKGRKRLEALYGTGRPESEMAVEKKRLYGQMRQDFINQANSFKILSYKAWFDQDLNNAHLVQMSQYQDLVPAFGALFRREGEDFEKFYRAVRTLMDLEPAARKAALAQLGAANTEPASSN